jgi:hypothetical protein
VVECETLSSDPSTTKKKKKSIVVVECLPSKCTHSPEGGPEGWRDGERKEGREQGGGEVFFISVCMCSTLCLCEGEF